MSLHDESGMIIEAVLFDLGNTLITSIPLAESLADLADSQLANELKLDKLQLLRLGQEIEKCIDSLYQDNTLNQPHWFDVWQQATTCFGIDLQTDGVDRLCRAHLKQFVAGCRVLPYSLPVLTLLRKAHIPVGLVSNVTGPVEIFDIGLADKGLAPFFQVVVWSSAFDYRKPDPRIFQAALDKLKLKPGKHIIMVGDSEQADILGGKRMGFTTVKIVEGEKKTESAADYVVTGPDLIKLFQLAQ